MAEQLWHILVPVDFSEHSQAAIAYATKLVQRMGGDIELLHVVEDPFVSGAWRAEAFVPNIPELLDQLVADARSRLESLRAATTAQGTMGTAHVMIGQPAQTIRERAASGTFDLIVMGTHGRTGVSHLFMGSVAERVVRTAPCPVLTVRSTPVRTEDRHVAKTVTVF